MNDQTELMNKYMNSRNLLKDILLVYLEECFFKKSIENCFMNDDINLDEINRLSKAIKINVYVKAYIYIIKVILGPKIKNNKYFLPIYQEISNINFDFDTQDELYDFADLIKTDKDNLLNRIIEEILEKFDELNDKLNKTTTENNNLKSVNRNLESKINLIEKDFQEEIKRSKDFLIKHNEITEKLQINHDKNIEIITNKFNHLVEEYKENIFSLEQEIKKLQDQKIEMKKYCEDTINTLNTQVGDSEFMIDRRVVGNCLIKFLDKKNKDKKIQQIVLETLANYLEYNNEERKTIGLSQLSVNSFKPNSNTHRDKIKEVSDNFMNFLTRV